MCKQPPRAPPCSEPAVAPPYQFLLQVRDCTRAPLQPLGIRHLPRTIQHPARRWEQLGGSGTGTGPASHPG